MLVGHTTRRRLARPGEVIRLLGLDERVHLASTVRVAVEFAFPAERRMETVDKNEDSAAGDQGQ